MAGGRKKAATATPQHQESGEEGEESEVEDQQDSTVFLQKRVDNLDVKINKVSVALGKLTKETSAPGILQEAAGAQSAPGSVSGESISSESALPVYSGDRLALVVGDADLNLEHDPNFRHLSNQWNQAFEKVFREGSKSVKASDRHKANLLSSVSRTILLLQSRAASKLSPEERDHVEETIELILSDLEGLQVRLQFLPDVAKKISESLQATAASRRSRVGHIFGIPAAFGSHFARLSRPRETS